MRKIVVYIFILIFLSNTAFSGMSAASSDVMASSDSLNITGLNKRPNTQREFLSLLYKKHRLIWIADQQRYKKILGKDHTRAAFLSSGGYY